MRNPHRLSTHSSDLSPLWISITRRASRDLQGTKTSAARHVFRFDEAGELHHKLVGWRPFVPSQHEHQVSTFSLFVGGRLLTMLEANTAQWQTIMAHGLERFIREAAASRDFNTPLSQAMQTR